MSVLSKSAHHTGHRQDAGAISPVTAPALAVFLPAYGRLLGALLGLWAMAALSGCVQTAECDSSSPCETGMACYRGQCLRTCQQDRDCRERETCVDCGATTEATRVSQSCPDSETRLCLTSPRGTP